MSIQVTQPPAAAGTPPPTDVFIAHRRRILAASAPAAVQPDAAPAPQGTAPTPPADVPPLDDSFGVDDDQDYSSDASPGFLQFPSDEDLDDDLADDDNDNDAPPPAAPSAPPKPNLRQRIRDINWKSPKVLIGALAALVLVAVMIIVFKPGPSAPPPLTISSAPPPAPAPPPAIPVDQPIKVESADARCPAGGSPAINAFDGSNDTAWTCKMAYGPGQILTISLGDVYVISKVTIIPGFNKIGSSGDEWNKYQTITKVRWLFGDYSPAKPCTLDNNCLEQNTNNTRDVVAAAVIPNKKTRTVRMVILKTTPPPSDTPILTDPTAGTDSFATSEIQVWGHPAG